MRHTRTRTLSDYLQILWRRKLMFLLVFAPLLILAFLIIARMPDVYESRATIVVATQQSDRQAVVARVAAATERLTSRSFLEPLIVRHGLYPGAVKKGNMDAAVAGMRQDIRLDISYRGDLAEKLTLGYRNTSPELASAVATDLIATFGNINSAIEKQMADEAAALDSEISEIEGRMRELGYLRASDASRRSSASRAASGQSAMRAARIAAASSAESLSDRLYALEQQAAQQKQQIAEQQKIVKLAPSDAKAGGSYGVLLVRKAELEALLKDYSTQYTEKNPKVVQARNQLAEINSQITQLSAANGQGDSNLNSAEARELRAMQRELTRTETELEITRRELNRKKQIAGVGPSEMPTAAAAMASPVAASGGGGGENLQTVADYDTLRKRYDSLLDKQDDLDKTRVAMAGLEPGIFQLVDMPSRPQVPAGPNRFKYQAVALMLALGLALLAVAIVEIPRLNSIRDDRDVEYYLGVPVIALIPETVAASEGGKPRQLLMRSKLGVFLAVLVPAILVLLNYLNVFQILATIVP